MFEKTEPAGSNEVVPILVSVEVGGVAVVIVGIDFGAVIGRAALKRSSVEVFSVASQRRVMLERAPC